MIRLGLCCKFRDEPIRFRITTAAALGRLKPTERRKRLAGLCMANARSLLAALEYCTANGIGDFRVNSQILPLKTHPDHGYELRALPGGPDIVRAFRECGRYAREHGLRTTFHPDQFILLSSTDRGVTARSVADLKYHAQVAEWIGADVINIHGGGAYGDKRSALARVARRIGRLPKRVRDRLTLENDDRVYTPSDLLPVCRATGVPLVYDVHHHRCLPDGLSVEEATPAALETWNREPLFHLSSPIRGWTGPNPRRHHDYVSARDFPDCWRGLDITIEVEAKAKERAVGRLARYLRRTGTRLTGDGYVGIVRVVDARIPTAAATARQRSAGGSGGTHS